MKKLLFSFTLLITSISFAQLPNSRVLVRNGGLLNNKQSISIKWYSNEFYYQEGVNVYRKESNGEWKKINSQPIKKLNDLPKEEYAKDKDLDFFIPAINKGKKENLKGLFFLNVLAKTFESEPFSRFLGIQWEDTTVTFGKIYSYKINKLKGSSEILIGESLPITAGQETIEEPIKDIQFLVDTNKVKFKWKHEEQRFYAVNVYREGENKNWVKLNKEPVMISKTKDSLGRYQYPKVFYLDDSLNTGNYSYQLAGVDFFGKETKRSEIFKAEIKDLIPPPAPENLEDSINNLEVKLIWKLETSKDIAGINVFRSTKSNGLFIKVNSIVLSPGTRTYIDKVPKAGPYYYYVSTIDVAGNEGKSDSKFSEVHDIVPPLKPIGVIAKADTGKIVLTWQKNKESDLSGYRVYRAISKNDRNKFVLLNSNPVKENTFIDKLPKNAKNNFLYKIIAEDSSYNKSEASEMVSVKMPDVIPPVKPYIKNLRNIDNAIILDWLSNKDGDLKGYEIYRATEKGKFIKINERFIGSQVISFTDNRIEAIKNYSYYIIAYDSAGNRSLPSNIWFVNNNYRNPKIIISDVKLKYQASKKAVNISWAYEEKEQLLGYVIYRKEGEKGQLVPVSEKVFKPGFIDRNVKESSTYYYEIRAYDKTGNIIKSEIKKITI